MKTINLFIACLLLFGATASAQGVKVISGSVTALKGEKDFLLKYDYSNMKVGKNTEEVYLKEKMEERDKKEPGAGEKFKQGWLDNRKNRFEPKFETLFNKYLGEKGCSGSQTKSDAKYTIIIHTVFTETGYNIGISRYPAYINVEIEIVETATNKSVAKLEIKKIAGQDFGGYDYDVGSRLEESYAKCGKILAKFLIDKALK